MNSPFAQIFLALCQRINTQVPDIKYIDQDLGQLKATKPPVAWPCTLIDFEDIHCSDLGQQVQAVAATVVITLGFAPHSNSSIATPISYVQQALGFYKLEWALHKALHCWAPTADIGPLTRTSTNTLPRTDSYRVRQIRYAIAFEDYSTKPQTHLVNAEVVVSEEVV